MKVLIIGGTNFIGPPVVWRLVGLGHELVVFHRGRTRADLRGPAPGIDEDENLIQGFADTTEPTR